MDEKYLDEIEEVESYDPEEEVFEGGPKNSQIEAWKGRFGDVYATEFDDEVFIWRTLSRLEYKEIIKIKNADPMYREERICEKCVLWPEQYDHRVMGLGKAGIPSLIAEQVMDKSGFLPNGEAKKL